MDLPHRTSTFNTGLGASPGVAVPNHPSCFSAYSAEDVPVTPSSQTRDSSLRIPRLEPIANGGFPADLAAAHNRRRELGGTTPLNFGLAPPAAAPQSKDDGLARTPSAPSFESKLNTKNCNATPATPKKVCDKYLPFRLY